VDNTDARDVSETVWRQLPGQLDTHCNPETLASWLAATTQQECDRIRRAAHGPGQVPEAANISGEQAAVAEQELLRAERHAALREAFAHLPPHCQRLIAMLIQDPPAPNAEISAKLGIPARSIRQNCHSCLQELRRYPAIAAMIHIETENARSKVSRRP
jgi:RNA polymerase sigma factor (sigma-70 family)